MEKAPVKTKTTTVPPQGANPTPPENSQKPAKA